MPRWPPVTGASILMVCALGAAHTTPSAAMIPRAGVLTVVTEEDEYLRALTRFATQLRRTTPRVHLHVVATNASILEERFTQHVGPSNSTNFSWSTETSHDRTLDEDVVRILNMIKERPVREEVRGRLRYRLMKLHHVARSPYAHTIFLDWDVLPCTSVVPLLAALDGGQFDLAVTPTFMEAGKRVAHADDNPYIRVFTMGTENVFTDTFINGGMLVYNSHSPAHQALLQWEAAFLAFVEDAVRQGRFSTIKDKRALLLTNDQPVLRHLLKASTGLRLGLIDGRWNQRVFKCIYPNGTVDNYKPVGVQVEELRAMAGRGCWLSTPFLYHGHGSLSRHSGFERIICGGEFSLKAAGL